MLPPLLCWLKFHNCWYIKKGIDDVLALLLAFAARDEDDDEVLNGLDDVWQSGRTEANQQHVPIDLAFIFCCLVSVCDLQLSS